MIYLFFSQKTARWLVWYLRCLSYWRSSSLQSPLRWVSLEMFVTACLLFGINEILLLYWKQNKQRTKPKKPPKNMTPMKRPLCILFTSLLTVRRCHLAHICCSHYLPLFQLNSIFPSSLTQTSPAALPSTHANFQQLISYVTSWDTCWFDSWWARGPYSFVLNAN